MPQSLNSPSLEEAARYAQTPQPDQVFPLQTNRQVSSIRRSGGFVPEDSAATATTAPLPHHQHGVTAQQHWVYPSEQQLYNAMRRKGWNNIPEQSIPVVLQIHNQINEGTWGKIIEWENNSPDITLVRFQGRPRDLSPQAFIWSKILRLRPTPFDRHDWYVAHHYSEEGSSNNKKNEKNTLPQRYVIDYYMMDNDNTNSNNNGGIPRTYVDVRPAWEGPRGIQLRISRILQDTLPGWTAYYRKIQSWWYYNNNNTTTTTAATMESKQPKD
jgi:cytochrome c heme-lyase